MLNHFPTLTIAQPAGVTATTASKFGGLPWGFPADAATPWPVCTECDCPMSFLAQFAHGDHLPRIGAGHSLFLFKCERDSICSFWEADGSANACIVVPHGRMGEAFVTMPHGGTAKLASQLAGADGMPRSAATPAHDSDDAPVLLELWVSGWRAQDDGIPPELEAHYYDQRFNHLPEAQQVPHGFDSVHCTKAGGVPYWTGNGNTCIPAEPGRMLLQIDNFLAVDGISPQALADYAAAHGHEHASFGDAVEIANFCSDGIAYVMDKSPDAQAPSFYLMILR